MISSAANPLISIVIPAYNRALKVVAAVKSIQEQTYQNWEVIVVDDGSKDDTAQSVQKLATTDNRIRFIAHEKNKGAQAARNTGIKAAKGGWIAFLDSDDIWLKTSLALRLRRAAEANVPVVYSGAFIQHEGKELQIYDLPKWNGDIYRQIITKEGPMFQSLLVKKEALEKINFLDEKITAYQEWDTSIRLAKHFQFAFEPEPTFVYDYTGADSISRNSIRAAKGYKQIMGKIFWDVWRFTGAATLAYHYQRIHEWFNDGGDQFNALRYKGYAIFWSAVSPSIVKQNFRQAVWKIQASILKSHSK